MSKAFSLVLFNSKEVVDTADSINKLNYSKAKGKSYYVMSKQLKSNLVGFMLTHNNGVQYKRFINELDFSVIDPFYVWSVFADYGEHQVCICQIQPTSISDGDAIYVLDVGPKDKYYVTGAEFVPGAVRNQLMLLSGQNKFDVYNAWLPCVTVKPVVTSKEVASAS
jgi:hypothetical protein